MSSKCTIGYTNQFHFFRDVNDNMIYCYPMWDDEKYCACDKPIMTEEAWLEMENQIIQKWIQRMDIDCAKPIEKIWDYAKATEYSMERKVKLAQKFFALIKDVKT